MVTYSNYMSFSISFLKITYRRPDRVRLTSLYLNNNMYPMLPVGDKNFSVKRFSKVSQVYAHDDI